MSNYSRFELIAPCHFGLEAVLKREITDLGYEIAEVMDGKVTFYGDEQAICYGNVFLLTVTGIAGLDDLTICAAVDAGNGTFAATDPM